jgi:putative FmdB family regulatory protein
MPTYEFRCPDGHEFEKFYRKISDAVSELPCPVCGKPAERQLSGGAGLHFKGSGFYLTDYGKNAHRKPAPTSDGAPKSSDKTPGEGTAPDTAAAKPEKPAEKPAAEAKPATKPQSSKPKTES